MALLKKYPTFSEGWIFRQALTFYRNALDAQAADNLSSIIHE